MATVERLMTQLLGLALLAGCSRSPAPRPTRARWAERMNEPPK